MWTSFFDRIVVINLKKREDRLFDIWNELNKYDIVFELFEAIECDNGAEGLRLTLLEILNESIKKEHKSILIFEDDCKFIEEKIIVDETMENAINQLPDDWELLYLSAQVTSGFLGRIGSNLLQLENAFATHSWAISLNGMKEIIKSELKAPIDNHIVATVQKNHKTYITYPILTTQKEDYSDIGKREINWTPFIVNRYNQQINQQNLRI